MNLIAIDTSTENCSVALLARKEIKEISSLTSQHHAEIVLDMVDKLLTQNGVAKSDLDAIVFGNGPGSFTGVRIATSTAQGLALGLNLKVVPVCSLAALALQACDGTDEDYSIGAIDARMGEVYIAIYKRIGSDLIPLLEPSVLKPQEACEKIRTIIGVAHAVGGGSGMDLLYDAGLNKNIRKRSQFPDAEYIMRLGTLAFERGETVFPEQALPLYVRNEVTWKKVSEQGKKAQ